jgi:propanediol utilization protein
MNFTIVAQPAQVIIPAVKVDTPLVIAGVQGPTGAFTPQTTTVTAQYALGSQRAVTASGEYAGTKPAIGFTSQAVSVGMDAPVVTAGDLNGFSGLILGAPIYLGLNGILTQTPVTTGIHQQLGYAKSSSTIIIQIQQPLYLG